MADAATMTARQVVDTISNTLSLVDTRLTNHGVRVANFVYPALRRVGGYSDAQMRDICLAALVHDIGAFKTDEIDRILHFETIDVWAHSVFGYVFMKELSPLAALAPAVFFHHATLEELERLHPGYHDITQIIHIADRMDVMLMGGGKLDLPTFDHFFDGHRGDLFRDDLVDLFRDVIFGAGAEEEKPDFRDMLPGAAFSREETAAYLNMIVLSIDFRSSQTVTHTLATICIAKTLAELMGLGADEIEKIVLGATLHDLGKQGTPLAILESASRLDDDQMKTMKQHVVLSNEVLKGNIDDEIRLIAVRHHEKLDGSGYPDGLPGSELTLSQRLLAVADILSALMGVRTYKAAFPKEKVLLILEEEKTGNRLDASVVDCAAANYERLRETVDSTAASTFATYEHVENEYGRYRGMVERGGSGKKAGLIIPDVLSW